MKPVYKINLPEYTVETKPNFDALGRKIDAVLKENFLGQNIIVRAIGSREHLGKTAEELVQIIQNTGTDRYDLSRQGDRYENIEGKHIDFFGMEFSVTEAGEYFKFLIEPFFLYPTEIRGALPIRIDIATIYDPSQLEVVEHQYQGREGEIKRDGYIFKNPSNKPSAIKGIIQITK